MKFATLQLIIIVLLAVSVSACKKDNSNYYIKFKANGQQINYYVHAGDSLFGYIYEGPNSFNFRLDAIDYTDTFIPIQITINNTTSIIETSYTAASISLNYSGDSASYNGLNDIVSKQVSITTINDKYVTGTFSFSFSGTPYTITDGQFFVPVVKL